MKKTSPGYREYVRRKKMRYYWRHREEINAKRRIRYAEDEEYRERHKLASRESMARSRQSETSLQREKHSQYLREYRERNREKYNQYMREYYKRRKAEI